MNLKKHVKKATKDHEIIDDVDGEDLSQCELVRIYAVKRTFRDVVFKQCNLTYCYFRNCRFIRCDFTGSAIKDCNFRGSEFEHCKFPYTSWEKTLLDERFLETCLPSEENLARDLVRSLRVNFSQVGNYDGVNRAASAEVRLTGQHLYNAAYSNQAYYRGKYKGLARVNYALRHARWKALDLLWGNGENLYRIVLWALLTIALTGLLLLIQDPGLNICGSAVSATSIFWGVKVSPDPSQGLVVFSTVARFVLLGLFMAVLIKRLSRR